MTRSESASRPWDGYMYVWRANTAQSGALTPRVSPHPGLEASHLGRSQSPAGQATGGSEHRNTDVRQPSPPATTTQMTSPTRTTTAGVRQAYPNVYAEPQPWHYYDPSRLRRSSSYLQAAPLPPSFPMPGPRSPSMSSAALVQPDPVLEAISASLRALQSQFAAFQENLGYVDADVKDVLSQLHALRTAQDKTDRCIAQLEDVVGVTSTATRARGSARRARGRGTRGGRAGTHTEPLLDTNGADLGTVPGRSLIQSMSSIQFAIAELLALENRASRSQSRSCSSAFFVFKCEIDCLFIPQIYH